MAHSHLMNIIEITDTHVKFLKGITKGGRTFFMFCDVREITQPTDAEVSKILSSIMSVYKIKREPCLGIIPRHLTILRHLSLPSHNIDELKKMIALQITSQVPYAKEDVVLDYTILDKEASGYSKVLVVVVHKDVVARYLKIFNNAKVNVLQLSLSSLGISLWFERVQERVKPPESQAAVIVNIDSDHTEICFYFKKMMPFSRSVHFGARHLNEENFSSLLEEINLTLSTYSGENIGPQVEQMIVICELGQMEGFKPRLEGEYKIPVSILDAGDILKHNKNLKLSLLKQQSGVSLVVPMGFTSGETKDFVNLMPADVSQTQEVKQKHKDWFELGALAVLAFILGMGIFFVQIYNYTHYLKELQAIAGTLEPAVKRVEGRIRQIEFIQEKINPKVTTVDILHELYMLTPADIYYNLAHLEENGALTLQGISETGTGVNNLQKNLVTSPLFKEATLQYATKRKILKGEVTDFKITCQIAPKVPPAKKTTRKQK